MRNNATQSQCLVHLLKTGVSGQSTEAAAGTRGEAHTNSSIVQEQCWFMVHGAAGAALSGLCWQPLWLRQLKVDARLLHQDVPQPLLRRQRVCALGAHARLAVLWCMGASGARQ